VPQALVGAVFIAGGVAVMAVQLRPGLPRGATWAAHLFTGGALLALWAAQYSLIDPLSWGLGAATLLRALAVLVLPWLSERAMRFDTGALQVRLALAFGTATLVPLLIAMPVTLNSFEQRRVERVLVQQERSATAGGALIAELFGNAPEDLAGVLGKVAATIPGEPGGAIGLVDAQGRVVAAIYTSQTAAPPGQFELLATAGALDGSGSRARLAVTPLGPHVLSAAPVPETSLQFVTAIARSRVMADLVSVRQNAFAVLMLTSLGAGVAGWWLAGWMARPIRELMVGVTRIARGERSVALLSEGPTELTHLSAAVEQMAAALDERLAEREQLVARLQTQNQELREHEQAREESIRALSHDLRNPLTALYGNGQRLARMLEKSGQAQESRIAQTIIALSRRLNAMIGDLADALRADAGAVPLRYEPLHLPTLVAELRPQLGEPEQVARVQLVVAREVPLIHADPQQIERVLTNLLTNALKYAPGETPVLVEIQPLEGEVVVAVTDRGVGMTAEEQAQLFRRYYRAERTYAMSAGLGLGLYVTRALVEAHGGRIWVESEPGVGSTFRFTLPCAPDSAMQSAAAVERDGATPYR
jgi:signal transduction histidine kinase